MSDPHWLVQELAGNAVWTAVGVGAAFAWKYRDAIVRRLPKRNMIVPLTGAESDELVGSLTVALTHNATSRSNATATATVSKDVQLLWNIEAPTPSFARRLEELAAWYLHVS
jgi:hypothetical protein